MNVEQTKAAIKVMQAYVEGEPIEVRLRGERGREWWISVVTPTWAWDEQEYRIKKEPRECYINEYIRSDGIPYGISYHSREEAHHAASYTDHPMMRSVAVKYREVLDE